MRDEIETILTRAARRLLWTRAVESSAVGGAVAALSAAWLELAWTVAEVHPTVAALLCLAPVAIGATAVAFRRAAGLLGVDRPLALLLAAVSILLGAAGFACVAGGLCILVSKWAILFVAVFAGAGAGVVRVLWRGVSRREAAVFLDVRGRLRERLGTAVELSDSPQADSPRARCVYTQALAAIGERRPERLPVWNRTRATAGALALTVGLCVTLAFVPTLKREQSRLTPEAVASALDTLPPAQLEQLVRALRKAAREAEGDPQRARSLFRAAEAVNVRNSERFEQLLRELEKQGVLLASLIPEDVQQAAGLAEPDDRLAAKPPATPGAGGDFDNGGREPVDNGGADSNTSPLPGAVRVAASAYVGAESGDTDATEPAGDGAGLVSYEDAWRSARSRADDALGRGEVPLRYRRLVREFFLADTP